MDRRAWATARTRFVAKHTLLGGAPEPVDKATSMRLPTLEEEETPPQAISLSKPTVHAPPARSTFSVPRSIGSTKGPSTARWKRAGDIDLERQDRNVRSKMDVRPPRAWAGYTDAALLHVLQHIFGNDAFRPGQLETIHEAGRGRDVFVLMPTGAGKSLCYQLPACLDAGVTVVVSPLLSLIEDQIHHLEKLGIHAKMLTSAVSASIKGATLDEIASTSCTLKLLYVTPEAIASSTNLKRALRLSADAGMLARFVIDEAHCINQWGHDFRKDYLALGHLRASYSSVPIMALTATASAKTETQIIDSLHLTAPWIQRSSYNRTNLSYAFVVKSEEFLQELRAFVATHAEESGIIYCLTQKDCEELATELGAIGSISFYHAALSTSEKTYRHRAWSRGDIKLMIATVAFGMGINKPDVRYVIHHSLPQSITHYYQESGRAGRDGLPAECIVYYAYEDFTRRKQLLRDGTGQSRQIHTLNVREMMELCENKTTCRRTMLLKHFGETFDEDDCLGTCDNCLEKIDPSPNAAVVVDVSAVSRALWAMLQYCTQKNVALTLTDMVNLAMGRQLPKKKRGGANNIPGSGCAKEHGHSRGQVQEILHYHIYRQLLVQTGKANHQGFTSFYMRLGSKWTEVRDGDRITMVMTAV
ncbi:hypothetical protein, variant [Saprolegnia diclina VS20]|uniref:ATP-dependent DNA helicase n=1 Tax=Saprolegnia diclina (strain VS20) TaxID=1156394 RepID=T0QH51_SAPDV|nr:hypothetical protein, variant [Saprolegnia diclina VS20]EQC34066.1 hypothetical protein, variant [Saprolegnia diclina VS20]|eukprot:XP_008612378.1 hypothetical protein, variant [Saprolegnia diclina VS20]